MAKCKFKVGDKVKPTKDNKYVITGQDMELGIVTHVGKCDTCSDADMEIKILKHKDKDYIGGTFHVESRAFKKFNETIVIYSDGNKVTALDKSTGKKAFTRCNPADEFDFHTGAKLAFSRLMREPENQQDKPKVVKCDHYEVGDKVLIRDWDDMEREFGLDSEGDIRSRCIFVQFMKRYCNQICTIKEITDFGNYTMLGDHSARDWAFSNDTIVGKVVEESEKPVDEFTPHLLLEKYDRYYGTIGGETFLKDAIGRPLRIGDTVDLYNSRNELSGELPIVFDGSGAFVMGLKSQDFTDKNGSTLGFKIILKRRHEEIADGESVGSIKYIKSQK